MSLLEDDETAYNLRGAIAQESKLAVSEYWEAYTRIEQQQQEQRRQELLGN